MLQAQISQLTTSVYTTCTVQYIVYVHTYIHAYVTLISRGLLDGFKEIVKCINDCRYLCLLLYTHKSLNKVHMTFIMVTMVTIDVYTNVSV